MDQPLSSRRLDTDNTTIWVAGVVLVIIGSIGNNLGNNLVSLHHKTEQKAEKERKKEQLDNDQRADDHNVETRIASDIGRNRTTSTLANPTPASCSWRKIGTIVFILGNLCTFASFGFAAQSLLASLESIQFVSNVFFVRWVHKETVTRRMLLATLSIVIGNTLVVIFSDHAAGLLTSADIIHLYTTNQTYWGYLVCAFVFWLLNHFTYAHYFDARVNKNKLLWKHAFIEPFTFAVSSAIIGTQAVLQSKCMSMLIQVSSRGIVNEFMLPHIWWILVSWIILVAYWLRRLDKGLELYPPLFIIPVLQVFFVFFAIVCGGIYFEEFVGFTYAQYIGFVIGVFMILGGVYGLAPTDIAVIKLNSVMIRHQPTIVGMGGIETPQLRVNNDEKEGDELILAANVDQGQGDTDDPRRVRRLTMEAHDMMYAIAGMTLQTAGMTMAQPMTMVPAILRQISGSIEEAVHALTNQPPHPHTPQIHPHPHPLTPLTHTPHIPHIPHTPHDVRGKMGVEENNKLIVDENEVKDRLPRPMITTAPYGGATAPFLGTIAGPFPESPATVAPAPYYNYNNNNDNNNQHHHNNNNHNINKVVPLVPNRVGALLQVSTQPADREGVLARRQEDREGVLVPRPVGGSPTVAIYHHRNRSDTMTPLI